MHAREMHLPTLAKDSNSCFLKGIITTWNTLPRFLRNGIKKKKVRSQTQRVKLKPNILDHKVQISFPHFSK